jgi:hypothetical protein
MAYKKVALLYKSYTMQIPVLSPQFIDLNSTGDIVL